MMDRLEKNSPVVGMTKSSRRQESSRRKEILRVHARGKILPQDSIFSVRTRLEKCFRRGRVLPLYKLDVVLESYQSLTYADGSVPIAHHHDCDCDSLDGGPSLQLTFR